MNNRLENNKVRAARRISEEKLKENKKMVGGLEEDKKSKTSGYEFEKFNNDSNGI